MVGHAFFGYMVPGCLFALDCNSSELRSPCLNPLPHKGVWDGFQEPHSADTIRVCCSTVTTVDRRRLLFVPDIDMSAGVARQPL